MHSALVRLQNVFGFFTTVAFSVAAVIALSSFISPQTPNADIQLRNVQVVKGRPHYYSYKKEEYANIRFDLDAGKHSTSFALTMHTNCVANARATDITTLFNWNTKQVFLYLKAVYPSPKANEPPSEAIIWDAILASNTAPWHTNHYIHPNPKTGKKSVLPKKSKKAQAAEKSWFSLTTSTPKNESPFPRGELHLKNQKPKYQITDITGKLQNRDNVTLELGWNIQPWVGALTWTNWQKLGAWEGLKGGRSEAFEFPEIGGKKKPVKKEELETEKGGEGHVLMAGEEQPVGRGSKA